MKKIGLLSVLLILLFGSFKPKAKSFEGTIKYAIDYHVEYGVIKYPQDLTVSIKGDIIRIDISLPFAEINHIIDCKKRSSLKLCTVDGIKYCVKTDLKKSGTIEKVTMAKDSTKMIKDALCVFGRIQNNNSHYTIYATEKYLISKAITDCGLELPYRLFYSQKEFERKLIMQQDVFDVDGQTTYLVESITESQLKESYISPPVKDYTEVTEEALGKIISNYFKSAR